MAQGAQSLCNHLLFCIQTVLFEVELIVDNAPLTYIYPNTIETCLSSNHLLFGWQLLHSSNTTSTVVRNLTVLLSTTDKRNRISNHFWDRWKHEHVVKLRETIRKSKLNVNSKKNVIDKDIVQVYEKVPKHFWRITIVTGVLTSRDSEIRGAIMRIEKDQYNSQTSRKLTFDNLKYISWH